MAGGLDRAIFYVAPKKVEPGPRRNENVWQLPIFAVGDKQIIFGIARDGNGIVQREQATKTNDRHYKGGPLGGGVAAEFFEKKGEPDRYVYGRKDGLV